MNVMFKQICKTFLENSHTVSFVNIYNSKNSVSFIIFLHPDLTSQLLFTLF